MDLDIDPPHIHSPGHAKTADRHWSDFALPIAALFVSLVSILIAWQHGEEMKKLVQANSFPYVQIYNSDVGPRGEHQFSLVMSNQGVGPAEIRTAELLFDGQPLATSKALAAACCKGQSPDMSVSAVAGRMLRPGEIAPYLIVPEAAGNAKLSEWLKAGTSSDRLETRLCFCSVFDECWTATSKGLTRPRPVAQCPPVDVMYLP